MRNGGGASRQLRRGASRLAARGAARAIRADADSDEDEGSDIAYDDEDSDGGGGGRRRSDRRGGKRRRRAGGGVASSRASRRRVLDDEDDDESGGEEEEEEEEDGDGAGVTMADDWLLRESSHPSEFVPQVGDLVVYLRRGHEQSVHAYPDRHGLPPPPYLVHPSLPNAVRCEVLEVSYLQAGPKEVPPLTRIHVGLKVCAQADQPGAEEEERAEEEAAAEGGAAGSADADDSSVVAKAGAVPEFEQWVVTVAPPAAGVTDFLILSDRYDHALNQWGMCLDASREDSR